MPTLPFLSGLLSAGVLAVPELTFTFASDYLYKGVSQTSSKPAIQLGAESAIADEGYLGVWASNVDFDDDTRWELDLYAGRSWEITDEVSLDLGLTHYRYFSGWIEHEFAYTDLFVEFEFAERFSLSTYCSIDFPGDGDKVKLCSLGGQLALYPSSPQWGVNVILDVVHSFSATHSPWGAKKSYLHSAVQLSYQMDNLMFLLSFERNWLNAELDMANTLTLSMAISL